MAALGHDENEDRRMWVAERISLWLGRPVADDAELNDHVKLLEAKGSEWYVRFLTGSEEGQALRSRRGW